MSDDTQAGTELFDSREDGEKSSEAANDNQDTSNSETDKKNPTVINREKMLDSWTGKLVTGKATLEDLPPAIVWAKDILSERLDKHLKTQDIDSIVEARLSKIRAEEQQKAEESKFEQLRTELNAKDLSEEDQALVQAKFNKFHNSGLSKVAALEEALDYFDLVNNSADSLKREQLKRMAIPHGGATKQTPTIRDEGWHKQGDAKSRVAEYEKIIKSGNKYAR